MSEMHWKSVGSGVSLSRNVRNLVETVFNWPGTGLLLNNAIFQRDLPLLQGTILMLALFFVLLNLIVDVMQTVLDPRIQRT